jgi:hypothetical protein
VFTDGIYWADKAKVNPRTVTLPICENCNNRLGGELEGPVSQLLPRIEVGQGITDQEAELLVRWLWKFEGILTSYAHLDEPDWRYSDRWTVIERVLGQPIREVRDLLTLAIGLTNQIDPRKNDWPMGIDSGISILDGFFVSGVFKKTAIMVSLTEYEHLIPGWFGKHRLGTAADPTAPVFFPPVCFPFSDDAMRVTQVASIPLKVAHERWAKEHLERKPVTGVRPRLHIPNS